MEQTFVLPTVLVANAFGLFLVLILIASNFWRLKDKSAEGRSILCLWGLTLVGCVLEPLAYALDGVPGMVAFYANYTVNSALYIINMLCAFCWFRFLVSHMQFRLKFVHKAILGGFLSLGAFTIILNCFMPVVFDVDSNNVYVRKLGYYLFVFIDHGFVIDSLILYLIGRKRGGLLKLFPVWVYALPFVAGTVCQSLLDGVSVLCSSYAVSIAGLLASLQKNMIYKDNLTGAFNKAYLDFISYQFSKEKNKKVTAILLNINGFKSINETYGRDVGDKVLQSLARLLSHAVGETGNVIRYSADEFFILMHSRTAMVSSVSIARVKANIADYNKLRDCPCKISVRMGAFEMDFGKSSINSKLNEMNQALL
ncbi:MULTISPECIES: GGDEF domain-containing protein [unclassified Fibrobacter]|uniref:GGDEF domain-containing protein n=1 Tax=unclassified Fibrobacter TaxID=2634177 RepID=UPI000D6D51AA|nr:MULTISPECIES: GGDEF domain-containing protein [unclassified Fibrobacter]PWJ68097.1 diguanylate cyclase (GGDEF)-like protein [Fibrobacter sp. UWR4]PZW71832.1 diguanylate cyclase (GGDEF)-like protein [Fibrobacter sp. UWR1]